MLPNKVLCSRVTRIKAIATVVTTKTAAPCCSKSYSNWNPAQKHTNIHCQTRSRTVLVIPKPLRPVHGGLACSLPCPSCSLFIASTPHQWVSGGQLTVSPLTVEKCQHHTHRPVQRNSGDQETVEKQPRTNCSKDPEEEVWIWAWFWICNRKQSPNLLRQFPIVGP